MAKHRTGTRKEWLAARLELLEAEKEHTKRGDELARQRQELPWVRIDKEYRFETDEGSASLKDLFRGRSQLLMYHFMFGPDYAAGCPACSTIADGFNGIGVHLANHDVMLWAVSRAPLEKLQGYKRRMGWTFPWASAFGSDFNYDFNVGFTEEQQREGGIEYNYRREPPAAPISSRATPRRVRYVRCHVRNRPGHVHAGATGHERVRARGRRRLPHLLGVSRVGWTGSGACTSGSTARPRGATRRASGFAATTSTARAERSHGVSSAVSALLFVASAAATVGWCASMSAMGGMPMPGGWTMSMAWMRMPGQTLPGFAASFLGMWVVMMVAMMLPSLVPRAVALPRGGRQEGWLTAVVGGGYFFVWTAVRDGCLLAGRRADDARDAAAGAGARGADRGRRGGADRGRLPAHRVEGA